MLHLASMELQAWPAGLQEMPDLQFLELRCMKMQDQDLASLQHIPFISLEFFGFSTLLLTSGSWQSFQIWGNAGFNVSFSNPDAFVRDTRRFLFDCARQQVGEMYGVLRAACTRQGVACYECEHRQPYLRNMATLSNVKLCKAPERVTTYSYHEELIERDGNYGGYWPSSSKYPELYS